jgi:hypothetical protein
MFPESSSPPLPDLFAKLDVYFVTNDYTMLLYGYLYVRNSPSFLLFFKYTKLAITEAIKSKVDSTIRIIMIEKYSFSGTYVNSLLI